MKTQQRLLYDILSNFEGMNKIDAFDLLQKIEILLFDAKSPLQKEQMKEIILSNIDTDTALDQFQFTILTNGNLCEFLGSNDWIHIYKEVRRGIGKLYPVPRYYYKTKYAPLKLVRFTHQNLLDSVHSTDRLQPVVAFMNNNSINAKNHNTGRLLLLTAVL